MEKKKYYITTAIAYASGKPHVGNTYDIIQADVIARYKRLNNFDVHFQTGTDEHGIKIEEKSKQAGITPQEFVDKYSNEVKKVWDIMNTSYDSFVRTTNPLHKEKIKKIFKKLYDKGDIYKGKYEGWYCTPCESFFTEQQLKDGKCPDCGRNVTLESEEAYFFKLSNYQDFLINLMNNSGIVEPEQRKNEMLNNFVLPGVQDLCVSRTTFDWGIQVDFDPKHIVYVWIDALSNYITFLGYDPDGNHSEEFKKYWPCDVHIIGKDILRFHSIYWPVMLKSLGLELPKKIFAHPWFMMNDDKMSKSKGNVIYADDLVNLFGVDAIRYYMISEMPYLGDGNMTYDLIIEKTNSDLANTLGNLVNRTIFMVKKYFDGIVPSNKYTEEIDKSLMESVMSLKTIVDINFDSFKTGSAISNIMEVYRKCNKYIDDTTPWVLAKDETKKDRLGTVLYNLLESIRISTVLLSAFLPDTAKEIFNQLNTNDVTIETIESFGKFKVGTKLNDAKVLFERIDKTKKIEEINNYYENK